MPFACCLALLSISDEHFPESIIQLAQRAEGYEREVAAAARRIERAAGALLAKRG
jgi:hypothetical protein